jgi:predicted permease
MLDNFIFSVNAVIPIFVVLAAGFAVGKLGLLDKLTVKKMNALVFKFSLPVMLFRDISGSSFNDILDLRLVGFAVLSTFAIFFATWLLAASLMREKKSIGTFVQGCFRSNYAIVGLPLIANILGDANTGKGALITTFILPLFNILAVIILSIYSEKKEGKSPSSKAGMLRGIALDITRNPMIIGILIGLPFSYFQLKLPAFVNTSIGYVAGMTTPLSLLAIGASINPAEVMGKVKWAAVATALKLVIIPLVLVPIAAGLGMDRESLTVLFVLYSVPTAVSSYIMADTMGGDSALASNIIIMTTLFSALTFTVGVFIMKTLGLI